MCASVAMPLLDCVKNCSTNHAEDTDRRELYRQEDDNVSTRARGNHTM
jgi:hypothetical protein